MQRKFPRFLISERCKGMQISKNAEKYAYSRYQRRRYNRERAVGIWEFWPSPEILFQFQIPGIGTGRPGWTGVSRCGILRLAPVLGRLVLLPQPGLRWEWRAERIRQQDRLILTAAASFQTPSSTAHTPPET